MPNYRAVNLTRKQLGEVISALKAADYYEWDDVGHISEPKGPVNIYEFESGNGSVVKDLIKKGIEVESGTEYDLPVILPLKVAVIAKNESNVFTVVEPGDNGQIAAGIIAWHQLTVSHDTVAMHVPFNVSPRKTLCFFTDGKTTDAKLLQRLLDAGFKLSVKKMRWKKHSA
jgi:hypothetical protein